MANTNAAADHRDPRSIARWMLPLFLETRDMEPRVLDACVSLYALLLERHRKATDGSRARREQQEVLDMISRVQRYVTARGRGWNWELLAVLDWDGDAVAESEVTEGMRLNILADVERLALFDSEAVEQGVDAQQRREVRQRRTEARAVLEDLRRHDLPQPDGERLDHRAEDARCRRQGEEVANAIGALRTALPHLRAEVLPHVGTTLALLEAEHDWYVKRDAMSRAVRSIHGRKRRVVHVKSAALRLLAEVNDLTQERLAQFIVDEDDRMRPRPCRQYASGGAKGKVIWRVKTDWKRGLEAI